MFKYIIWKAEHHRGKERITIHSTFMMENTFIIIDEITIPTPSTLY